MKTYTRFLGILLLMLSSLIVGCDQTNPQSPQGEQVETRSNPEGWSSETGFRHATTDVQIDIVETANTSGSSGPSKIAPAGATWLTDMAGGDGARWREAIKVYEIWFKAYVPANALCQSQNVPSSVISAMKAKLNGPSGCSTSCSCSVCCYLANTKILLVNEMISHYNDASCNAGYAVSTPNTDQATLTFMLVRRQCLEWAETVSKQNGGHYRGYNAPEVSASARRPGMGFYKTDHSHAAIVVDIYWSSSGSPLKYRIREANYSPTGWNNPCGSNPWLRVKSSRTITSYSGWKVINYE